MSCFAFASLWKPFLYLKLLGYLLLIEWTFTGGDLMLDLILSVSIVDIDYAVGSILLG